MSRSRLAALVCGLLFPWTASAQAPPPRAGDAVTANERFVYVLRSGVLHQFDALTLRRLRSVAVPGGGRPLPDPVVLREGEVEEPAVEEPAVEEEVIVEEEFDVAETEAGAPPHWLGVLRREGRERLGRGGRATAEAIERALEWLAEHQDEDGKWDSDQFWKHDRKGTPTDGPGNSVHDVGVTGLALLAFLADGNTLRTGPYRDVVKAGVKWLREQQDPTSGLFGTPTSASFIYDHAIATLAMVEAYGLSDYKLLRANAQRAIDYLEWHRNPYGVWRYQPRDNDNDTSVTGWCVMAYVSAKEFGLDINEQALRQAETWFEAVTDPATGRTGYTERGGLSSRLAGEIGERFPREFNEAMTGLAVFCRVLLGQRPQTQAILQVSADLIAKKPPVWEPDLGRVDFVAWLFETWAMFQVGGRHWSQWAPKISVALVGSQRADGAFAGSWDPVGPWGIEGGRVAATAMAALTLETYYRYPRLSD